MKVLVSIFVGHHNRTNGNPAPGDAVMRRRVNISRVPCVGEFLDFGTGMAESEREILEVHHVAAEGPYNEGAHDCEATVWLDSFTACEDDNTLIEEEIKRLTKEGWGREP